MDGLDDKVREVPVKANDGTGQIISFNIKNSYTGPEYSEMSGLTGENIWSVLIAVDTGDLRKVPARDFVNAIVNSSLTYRKKYVALETLLAYAHDKLTVRVIDRCFYNIERERLAGQVHAERSEAEKKDEDEKKPVVRRIGKEDVIMNFDPDDFVLPTLAKDYVRSEHGIVREWQVREVISSCAPVCLGIEKKLAYKKSDLDAAAAKYKK
ncbi:MAG: hypothetical protein D6797_03985 [Bdellovibrio sp.]|nr:MAG: hypothetical protein D6797_03985 [Bdellovibrio sp.]